MRKASFGSISSGTLNARSLADYFQAELGWLAPEESAELRGRVNAASESDADMADLVEELIEELNSHAPDYGYFGAHPDDPADFGFWLHDDWERMAKEDGVLFLSAGDAIPDNFTGSACFVTDHGVASFKSLNATLVAIDAPGSKPREIWSIV